MSFVIFDPSSHVFRRGVYVSQIYQTEVSYLLHNHTANHTPISHHKSQTRTAGHDFRERFQHGLLEFQILGSVDKIFWAPLTDIVCYKVQTPSPLTVSRHPLIAEPKISLFDQDCLESKTRVYVVCVCVFVLTSQLCRYVVHVGYTSRAAQNSGNTS